MDIPPTVIRSYDEIPHLAELSFIPCHVTRNDKEFPFLATRELAKNQIFFTKTDTAPITISSTKGETITHVCLYGPSPISDQKLITLNINYQDKPAVIQGPYRILSKKGWSVIPIFDPNDISAIQVNSFRGKPIVLKLSGVALLNNGSNYQQVHTWSSGTSETMLRAVADVMFLKQTLPPGPMKDQVDSFLRACPPTIQLDKKGRVMAHEIIIVPRIHSHQSFDPMIAWKYPPQIVAISMWYLYTGDMGKLVGWFEQASQSPENYDTEWEKAIKHTDCEEGRKASMSALYYFGGALPFYLLACEMGLASLRAACEEYYIWRMMLLGGSSEAFKSGLKLSDFTHSEFLGSLLLFSGVRAIQDPKAILDSVPSTLARKTFLARDCIGQKIPEDSNKDPVYKIIKDTYPPCYTKPISEFLTSKEVKVPQRVDSLKIGDEVCLRPEIVIDSSCPGGSPNAFPAQVEKIEKVMVSGFIPTQVVLLKPLHEGEEPFNMIAFNVVSTTPRAAEQPSPEHE